MTAPQRAAESILIVERDLAVAEPLRQALLDGGYSARIVADAAAALEALRAQPPALAIVDWDLPGHAAIEIVQRLGAERARVIVVSALGGEQDVVTGLSLGADDYVVRPFSTREIVARVGAVLRLRRRREPAGVLVCGALALDPAASRATAHGEALSLREAEFRLLEVLMRHPDRTFDRRQLRARIWGEGGIVEERTVDVTVQRLRKVLAARGCPPHIETVRGFGYRFAAAPADR